MRATTSEGLDKRDGLEVPMVRVRQSDNLERFHYITLWILWECEVMKSVGVYAKWQTNRKLHVYIICYHNLAKFLFTLWPLYIEQIKTIWYCRLCLVAIANRVLLELALMVEKQRRVLPLGALTLGPHQSCPLLMKYLLVPLLNIYMLFLSRGSQKTRQLQCRAQ